jgi:outer membrane lipopolysaccharide assembly protein LptE/RlpB
MKKTYVRERKELLALNKSAERSVFSDEMVRDLPEQIKKNV